MKTIELFIRKSGRNLWFLFWVAAMVAGIFLSSVEKGQAAELFFNSSGGAQEKAQREAYFNPYEKETGVKVVYTAPCKFAKLKLMVESGNVEWDITELPTRDKERALEYGYLEPLDWDFIDPNNEIPKNVRHKYAFPGSSYSTILGYRTTKYSKENHPRNWKEFWDVKKFPGGRSLRNDPVDNLEMALLADGVPKAELYPMDIDRAFNSLDKIKPHITVWWSVGAQPAQLLASGEVEFVSAWDGRITAIKKEKSPVEIEWSEGILKISWYGIPKGAKNKESAMKMLKMMARGDRQAIYAKIIGYGGHSKRMLEYLDPTLSSTLSSSPENVKIQVMEDTSGWWLKNVDKVTERWHAWMLK